MTQMNIGNTSPSTKQPNNGVPAPTLNAFGIAKKEMPFQKQVNSTTAAFEVGLRPLAAVLKMTNVPKYRKPAAKTTKTQRRFIASNTTLPDSSATTNTAIFDFGVNASADCFTFGGNSISKEVSPPATFSASYSFPKDTIPKEQVAPAKTASFVFGPRTLADNAMPKMTPAVPLVHSEQTLPDRSATTNDEQFVFGVNASAAHATDATQTFGKTVNTPFPTFGKLQPWPSVGVKTQSTLDISRPSYNPLLAFTMTSCANQVNKLETT